MLDITDWSIEEINGLMDTADKIIAHPNDYASWLIPVKNRNASRTSQAHVSC